jgi:hypothetical protein
MKIGTCGSDNPRSKGFPIQYQKWKRLEVSILNVRSAPSIQDHVRGGNQGYKMKEGPNMVASILKSPYAIIVGLTVLMFVCMQAVPKEQLNEQMKQMNTQMGSYQNLFKQNDLDRFLYKLKSIIIISLVFSFCHCLAKSARQS